MFNFLKNSAAGIALIAVVLSLNMPFALAEKVMPNTIPCPQNLPCIQEETQKTGKGIRDYITGTFGVAFLKSFLGLAAATSVVFIIVGGLQMHLAFGNEEDIGKAKKTLIWAIAGLVIAILSVAIVQIITNIEFEPPKPKP